MHICYLTGEYPQAGLNQGGIGSVVQTLARALVTEGLKVSVVGIGNVTKEFTFNDKGVDIYVLPQSKLPFANFIPNTLKQLSKLKEINKLSAIDIIEGSELNFAFIPKAFPAKKVIRMHGGHHFFADSLGKRTALWRSFQEKLSFNKADGLVAVSDFVGNKTKELLNFKSKFTTIYNVVDTTKFYKAKCHNLISFKLVFVGTLCEKKGIRQLVQAMPLILNEYPKATLDIIGRDWYDAETKLPYSEFLKGFITPGTEKSISIIGASA